MSSNLYHEIWERSRVLSRPYWTFYEQLIGQTSLNIISNERPSSSNQLVTTYQSTTSNGFETDCDNFIGVETDDEDDKQYINPDYLEFIKVTRKHQAERDRLKKLELKKNPQLELEEFYTDISQVNTLVEANLVEVPNKGDGCSLSRAKQKEERLIKLYGGQERFEKIRSLEMIIDENFNKKCQEFCPSYWPVIPLNPKPYLNPILQ